jgi:Uncharacterized oxidoreductases, Fe-dependent alcohol dehydrogenase family
MMKRIIADEYLEQNLKDAGCVVTNEETNEKIGVGGYDSSFPVLSIIDPELMVLVPPICTHGTGTGNEGCF